MPGEQLYLGPYWATIRELPGVASEAGLKASLWIASAGYGLVPSDAPLHGYSATFQVGSPDAVAAARDGAPVRDQVAAWWDALAGWPGPVPGAPRRVADLANEDPRATLIVVASPRYVQAMASDLLLASRVLHDRLIVVSSTDADGERALAGHLVPSEAPLLSRVGGSLPSLHARVARDIVAGARAHRLRASELQERYRRLIDHSPYSGMPTREVASDAEVSAFIQRALRQEPRLRHTPALRMWRSAGRACEQKRFKRLFHEVGDRHVH